MNKSVLISVIAFALMLFLAARGVVYLVCEPTQNHPVVAAVSNAMAPADPLPKAAKPDPLSWEPLLRSLVSLISKACPK